MGGPLTHTSPASGPTTAERTDPAPDPRPVLVEAYALRVVDGGGPAYRRCAGPLVAGEDPDSAARRIAGVEQPTDRPRAPFVHSTSWRYTAEGHVVLSYVVVPDPDPAQPAAPLGEVETARGASPDRPSPARVTTEQVAEHALRHLAFLLHHDAQAHEALARDPAVAAALALQLPAPSGQLSA